MTSLDRGHRRMLETTVRTARGVAEDGARQVLDHLSVAHHEPRGHLSVEQRKLRNRLRAHGRQLGDRRDGRGAQKIDRLIEQVAYEHWHRMLFARFLAENSLLIEPETGVPISLDDCRELAGEQGLPWVELASRYAVQMLSHVFRLDDPVLETQLPAEKRAELESLLEALPAEVFTASDSLGWTYQFWRADQKDAVNASEVKIGAEELAPVTQLFTEDYMVDFLLHNTVGAWWANKLGPIDATDETEARARVGLTACDGLPSITWQYLRFVHDDSGKWRPAVGRLDDWPKAAREITVLDPCMGSGHFLVFALPILARLRMEEERIDAGEAIERTLHENLFGLELDERCTQIAAFSLALTAWRLAGYRSLPQLNLACSGLSIAATKEEWVALAGDDVVRQAEMKALYSAFRDAPLLGSLIDPTEIARAIWADPRGGADQSTLFASNQEGLLQLLTRAAERSTRDESTHELAVTASGIARAAQILSGKFTLVATNVPYLGRAKQSDELKDFLQNHYGRGKADLATCFIERCVSFTHDGGATATVAPQNWLFLAAYKSLREHLLNTTSWKLIARLGPGAFETIGGEVVNVALSVIEKKAPSQDQLFAAADVAAVQGGSAKRAGLRSLENRQVRQDQQLRNPSYIIQLNNEIVASRLGDVAFVRGGTTSGDSPRFRRCFWEVDSSDPRWAFQCGTVEESTPYGGREFVLLWENGEGELFNRTGGGGATIAGREVMGHRGVAISYIGNLTATLYLGEVFENVICVAVPHRAEDLAAVWSFVTSGEFTSAVRSVNQNLGVSVRYFEKAPMDIAKWREFASMRYPLGLPAHASEDPTQWLFGGSYTNPATFAQVGVARLCGYRWPLESQSLYGHPIVALDAAARRADDDGVVCLPALQRELPADERLRAALLAVSGNAPPITERDWLPANSGAVSLGDWLDREYFEQHCNLFHDRPFIWHIWDGLRDGFAALINYHRIAAPNGEGRRTLEKLTHTYLGDWITRQRAGVTADEDGAEARLAAAEHLREQLLKILEGEPPFDIFVRWKPLHEQPIGWEPDINDGVRINIRPFMLAKTLNARGKNACILRVPPKIKWDKDRGKEPERDRQDYPWFWSWDQRSEDFEGGKNFDGVRWNDLHYTRAFKEAAREAHAKRTKGRAR